MVIKMKWNDRFHEVIEYIEICLQQYHEDISVKDIESIMDCSYDLFQKMFSYQCGLGFSEYIRNRKMTLAGYDLKSTDLKVIEISYKYGYESPTSFTKAFQTFHGVSPSIARKNEVMLKTYPKMKLNLKKSYPWFLERKEKMRIIGKSIELVKEDLNNEQLIPAFWSQCFQDGTFAQLVEMDESSRKGCFGLFCNHQDKTKIKYMLGVISSCQNDHYETYTLPHATWAVFECCVRMPQAIQDGWRYLEQEWFAEYPFQHAGYPEMEWHSQGNGFSDNYLSEIWIPIIEEENENGSFGLL